MSEELEQAVVKDTDEQAKPVTEVADAREDDLDTLLSQYEQETEGSKSEPEPTGTGDPTVVALANELREFKEQSRRSEIEKVIQESVEALGADTGLPSRVTRGWLEEIGREKPELVAKFFGSEAERTKLLGALKKEFLKDMAVPDRQLTEDREAVSQAVRGASTKAPDGPPPSFGGMNNNEFAEEVENKYGFRPI